MKRQQSTHPLQAGPGKHVERENKGKTENIYKNSMSVGSTNERFTQVSTPPPFLQGGEKPFHATDNATKVSEYYGSQNFGRCRNAYPVVKRRWADWQDLLSPRPSAFYVQPGREPQRGVAGGASES